MSTSRPTDDFFRSPVLSTKDTTEHAASSEEEQGAAERPRKHEEYSGSTIISHESDKARNELETTRPETKDGAEEASTDDRKVEKGEGQNTKGQTKEFVEPEFVERIQDLSLSSQAEPPSTMAPVISALAHDRGPSHIPPLPPPKDVAYLDPTPKTPRASPSPTRTNSTLTRFSEDPNNLITFDDEQSRAISGASSDAELDEQHPKTRINEANGASRSEIQSIMDQFDEGGGGPGMEDVMSPRLELANPFLGVPVQHPPRNSSLEPLKNGAMKTSRGVSDASDLQSSSSEATAPLQQGTTPSLPPESPSIRRVSLTRSYTSQSTDNDTPVSPNVMLPLHQPPPPEPDPEPELPFDFHRFLEQLRHRTADPVAKFLRSFLLEFGKKQWMVHEQVKIIGDFLLFITNKMAQCEVWRGVSDAEFDNAREGMEKLVMNRLYTQTFSPAIPPPALAPAGKGKRKNTDRSAAPGRRGQHQEDIERDEVLAQKVRIYGWVREEHLDIAPVGESGRRFLVLAQQGL